MGIAMACVVVLAIGLAGLALVTFGILVAIANVSAYQEEVEQ